MQVQWSDNNGKCGVCGDPFNAEREHETGGFYARNITVRTYAPSSPIDIVIDIVANHGGSFKFEMCWRNDSIIKGRKTIENDSLLNICPTETEECFETLQLSNGKYAYPLNGAERPETKIIQVKLPQGRVCTKCVLRWHWKSGIFAFTQTWQLEDCFRQQLGQLSRWKPAGGLWSSRDL